MLHFSTGADKVRKMIFLLLNATAPREHWNFRKNLPDTNAEGAYLFAESLRKKIEDLNIEHNDSNAGKKDIPFPFSCRIFLYFLYRELFSATLVV
jgi:hypothetical protein